MEPATGASTWALGNHKCNGKTGSLTKNAPERLQAVVYIVIYTVIGSLPLLYGLGKLYFHGASYNFLLELLSTTYVYYRNSFLVMGARGLWYLKFQQSYMHYRTINTFFVHM
jgi:hypothetical protein